MEQLLQISCVIYGGIIGTRAHRLCFYCNKIKYRSMPTENEQSESGVETCEVLVLTAVTFQTKLQAFAAAVHLTADNWASGSPRVPLTHRERVASLWEAQKYDKIKYVLMSPNPFVP